MNTTSPRYKIKSELGLSRQTEKWWLKVWRYCHWLSLDVAIGASISAAWVNYSWGGTFSWWASLALSAGALWVYSVDHWADALKVAQKPPEVLSPRRKFYVKSRWFLLCLALISTILGVWAAIHLPWSTLGFGAVIVLACGAYLWITQKRQDSHKPVRYPKEMVVTSLYALALTAWPLSQSFDNFNATPLKGCLTSCFIFTLAWANVCLISVHERKADAAEGMPSLALWLGEYTTRNVGNGILKLAFSLWLIRAYICISLLPEKTISLTEVNLQKTEGIAYFQLGIDHLISGAMLYTLWFLYNRPEWSALYCRYRRWADIIFLYPAWVLMISS